MNNSWPTSLKNDFSIEGYRLKFDVFILTVTETQRKIFQSLTCFKTTTNKNKKQQAAKARQNTLIYIFIQALIYSVN